MGDPPPPCLGMARFFLRKIEKKHGLFCFLGGVSHVKNSKKWMWDSGRPPPCFFKIPTFSRFFFWQRPSDNVIKNLRRSSEHLFQAPNPCYCQSPLYDHNNNGNNCNAISCKVPVEPWDYSLRGIERSGRDDDNDKCICQN